MGRFEIEDQPPRPGDRRCYRIQNPYTMKHWKIRFSIRQMLLTTAMVAIAIALVRAWPTFGPVIGPIVMMVALVTIPCFAIFRRYGIANKLFKASVTTFALTFTLYLSIGPACWAMASFNTPGTKYPLGYESFCYVYRPVATNAIFSPEPIRSASMAYMNWWMPKTATFHDWGKGIGWSVPGWTFTIIHY